MKIDGAVLIFLAIIMAAALITNSINRLAEKQCVGVEIAGDEG